MNKTIEKFKNYLQEHGYRFTLGRQAVLKILNLTSQHLSAEQVYQRVSKIYPNLGLATIYRTLELLHRLGLILKFDFGERRARYEVINNTAAGKHHHHLICLCCRCVINYDDFIDEEEKLMRKTQQGLSKKYHFQINKHIVQFYGLCTRCRQD